MKLNKLLLALYLITIFLLGFVFGQIWDSAFYGGITGRAIYLPSDYVSEDKFEVYKDKVVIKIEGARISSYYESGSMLPTLGGGVNGISVAPKYPEEINLGDIVSFRKENEILVHRVVKKGIDSEGIFFVTKGDNSLLDDGKIRFEQIEGMLVGILY